MYFYNFILFSTCCFCHSHDILIQSVKKIHTMKAHLLMATVIVHCSFRTHSKIRTDPHAPQHLSAFSASCVVVTRSAPTYRLTILTLKTS